MRWLRLWLSVLSIILFVLCALPLSAQPAHPIDCNRIKVDTLLWDLKKLSDAPPMTWLNAEKPVRSLVFEGENYNGHPTKVFAYYSNPALIRGLKNANHKYPGVILVHGGGGKAYKQWVEKWAADGYAAMAIDFSGTGGDDCELSTGSPMQTHKEKFDDIRTGNLKNMWTYHAVASILRAHSLLLSFAEVDVDKTAITGISWGGYLTCLSASLDNRFKAAAPVYGCGFYSDCTFRKDLEAMAAADRTRWLKYFDPSSYLQYATTPFLFINGNKDGWFFIGAYHKTYSLISSAQRTILICPDMKHSHDDGWAPEEIKCFFDSHLSQGYPLVKTGAIVRQDSMLILPFESGLTVTKASFFYTTDDVAPNTNRQWKEIEAQVNQSRKRVSCNPPAYKIGFFVLKDVRNMRVSSEFIFNNNPSK